MPWTTLCPSHHLSPGQRLRHEGALLLRDPYSRRVYAIAPHQPQLGNTPLEQAELLFIGDRPILSLAEAEHHFSLETGECLEFPALRLKLLDAREWRQQIEIYLP